MVTQPGIAQLVNNPQFAGSFGRCGLLANQASVDQHFKPSWRALQEILGPKLACLFGPQHGFEATVQDNMIETGHGKHLPSGLPVYSLYSETREPTDQMLNGIDTILIDLQIVGCRVYTFKYTIAGCLRAAKKSGKKVVVLDRPNPLGGVWVAGRVLEPKCRSFVGEFPIPLKHGLTAAESALYFNQSINADLEVVPMKNWDPESTFERTGLPWVITSPNLPTLESVHIYPGTVLLEGTNVSEGRGTCLPFQFVGAPYVRNPHHFVERVESLYGRGRGVVLRPTSFQPTNQKWKDQICQGFQIHLTEEQRLNAVELGLAIIHAASELYRGDFQWKNPPYEYDLVTLPIKLLVGSLEADKYLTAGSFDLNLNYWHEGVSRYIQEVKNLLLYKRTMKLQAGRASS